MYGSTIRKENGYNADSYTYYPVVIIGAGESGIAMGCRLKDVLGCDQFRIVERQSGIGGTWWINRYPGVACDVPAVFYSFSFCQNSEWTTYYPPGTEIVQYLQDVCEKYKITDKIQVNTEVAECRWNEAEEIWDLKLKHLTVGSGDLSVADRNKMVKEQGWASVYVCEERVKCKVLVSAVGGLVEPKSFPENIPGSDKFQGEIFHSARWRYDVDIKDKDVIVVGTGCSAAQFVPRLTKEYGAKSVTQLMRSPPWIVPRASPPFGDKKWAEWAPFLNSRVPFFQRGFRALIATAAEYDWRLFGSSEWSANERKKLEGELLQHMKKTVPKKYHEILEPDYSVGCKRRIFDASWLPSLNDEKIELTTLPLTNVGEDQVTLGPGRLYPKHTSTNAPDHEVVLPADIIILANGFEITEWLHPIDIRGRDGKSLHEVYEERGGPQMYMGTAMDGFPNFFVLFGPNTVTGHSSVVLATENMVSQSLKLIRPILKGEASQVEIKKQAEVDWATDIQKACKRTVLHTGGCQSWYKTDSGWNSTIYPYSQIWFTLRCIFPKWSDWQFKYTAKGLRSRRVKTATRVLTCALLALGIYRARKAGHSLNDVQELARSSLGAAVDMSSNILLRISGNL